jgi:glutamyl-tRNA synthetase
VYAYQLVVAVDDAAMRISHVVRADDLLASTPRQLLLMRLLGVPSAEVPSYAHVPMVVAATGDRLAKRVGSTTIRALRERGLAASDIIGPLAHGLGLVSGDARPMSAREVAASLQPASRWRLTPWPLPPAWT